MTTTISRKRATEAIDAIMTQLYHISIGGAASSSGDQVAFVATLQEIVQLRFEDDYIAALNGMSMEAFTEYYNLFFDLTKAMGLESVKDLANYKVVSTKTLPDSLAKAKKTGDVVELLDGFNTFELSSIPYSDRIKSIERILNDWFWLGAKDEQIIKIMASMSAEEQTRFLSRLMNGKDPILPKLLSKVDGPEKLSMFLFLQTMFLMSGMNADSGVAGPTVRNDPRYNSFFDAKFDKGLINLSQYGQTNSFGGVDRINEWKLSPFTQVTYANGDKSFTVPAFFLTDKETLAAAIGEETLLSVLWGAAQGEFNEDPTGKQILADIGINFIPIVGQICDARDIAACLDKLINKKRITETMVWVTLILTAIGCIPYAGDVVKGALKAILKGADDVALILVKKIGGDNVAIAIKVLVSKLDDSLPEIRKLIQGWAADAAKKGSPNAAEFFAKMDEMIDAAVREIRTKIDEFGKKVGGSTDDFIHDGSQFMGKYQLKPNIKYEVNGYIYETDNLGRIKRAEGELTLQKGTRNTTHQKKAGGEDRITGDDGDHGGHLIGTRFNGSPLIDNIVAMNGKVNLNDYKVLENAWENALKEVPPKKVVVNIKPVYNSTSKRPISFKIEYEINSKKYNAYIANQ